jgi:hypothetical protein
MKGSHDSASADALMRLGVTLARSGCDALALLTDDPGPGVVEAADCIDAAMLALSAELNRERKIAGGEA